MKRTSLTPNAKPRRRFRKVRFETVRALQPTELALVRGGVGCQWSHSSYTPT